MSRIQQLPPEVVTKIAAGEVIERPASVIKELLENSLDAGATRIDIEIEKGGTELIRVVDNGHGIHPDDFHLVFASHATSKLTSAEELFSIHTMGFRGEALASVGGVARVLLQSRTEQSPTGHELRCEGGQLSDLKPWNGSTGTRIEVKHLFYNLPVRKKFLKSIPTELGHVSEMITRVALAHPQVHITLRHNGRQVYDLPAGTVPERAGLFFGRDVRESLLEIEPQPGAYQLAGFVADPKCDRGNAKLQYLYINGRWFRDRSVGHALQEGYRGLLITGRYAVAFLYLTVPADEIDVNVHPTKAEVRFRDNSVVYSLVRSGVKNRLLKANLIPEWKDPGSFVPTVTDRADSPTSQPESPRFDFPTGRPRPAEPYRDSTDDWPFPAPKKSSTTPAFPLPSRQQTEEADEGQPSPFGMNSDLSNGDEPSVPPIGQPAATDPGPAEPPFDLPELSLGAAMQVHDSYIVVEAEDGMLVIDQHALHERILYEQLRQRLRDGKLEIQRLLIPEQVELPGPHAAVVLAAAEELAELGLEVSDFGGGTILLSSYPTLLGRRSPREILLGVVDQLLNQERAPSREQLLDNLLATMACKAAVKAGDRLSADEISHLLSLRQLAEDSHHCPHGRPTSLLFSRKQLDRQFGRI